MARKPPAGGRIERRRSRTGEGTRDVGEERYRKEEHKARGEPEMKKRKEGEKDTHKAWWEKVYDEVDAGFQLLGPAVFAAMALVMGVVLLKDCAGG